MSDPVDLNELEAAARAVKEDYESRQIRGWWAEWQMSDGRSSFDSTEAALIAACSPDVVLKLVARLRQAEAALTAAMKAGESLSGDLVSLREALAAVSSQRDINLERAIAAENERHRNANLVRAVTDGIAHEQVTDIINAEGFDAVPWMIAETLREQAGDGYVLYERTETGWRTTFVDGQAP